MLETASVRQLGNLGAIAARRFAESLGDQARTGFARAFTAGVIQAYWNFLQERLRCSLSLISRAPALFGARLSLAAEKEAEQLGACFADLDPIEAGYSIGCVYTAALPPKFRSEYGAYYTPPALSNRLIQMSTEASVDWKKCRVLDASCGGAAFLAPVALKMIEETGAYGPKAVAAVAGRLKGFEIDPFAAWMSQVLVEAAVLPHCASGSYRLPALVEVCNSLDRVLDEEEKFDLVIGNPPYGRIRLDPHQRTRFARSLYGHANLYGVFTHAALGWLKRDGVIGYVTPTSMLGGQYYKGLRALLGEEAPPRAIEFISDREGVFEDVLQETMLAVYKRGSRRQIANVRFIKLNGSGDAKSLEAGTFRLPDVRSRAWIIPRTPDHAALVHRMHEMPTRLADYGYGVSTGPLVWNRHKGQFHSSKKEGMFPVIWAEAVTSSGRFEWRSEKRGHLPWFKPREKDFWVITRHPCVLVQRTTAKEQVRRLIAAELPASFIRHHKGVIVENHLNMVRPIVRGPAVATAVVTALLKSALMDSVFRCINGSVAVSAYELESLPLPSIPDAKRLEQKIAQGLSAADLECEIEKIYLGSAHAATSIA